jgi:cytochrome bd ubiquinol oxidase subunit I
MQFALTAIFHMLWPVLTTGINLSTVWILIANAWLPTPAGGTFVDGKFIVGDYFAAITNPFALISVSHMFFATLETSLFVIGGISAWYIFNCDHWISITGLKQTKTNCY